MWYIYVYIYIHPTGFQPEAGSYLSSPELSQQHLLHPAAGSMEGPASSTRRGVESDMGQDVHVVFQKVNFENQKHQKI